MHTRRSRRGSQPAAAGPGKQPVAVKGIPVLTLSTTFGAASDSLKIKQVEEQVSALRTSVICAFNQLLDLKDLNTQVHTTPLPQSAIPRAQTLQLEAPV